MPRGPNVSARFQGSRIDRIGESQKHFFFFIFMEELQTHYRDSRASSPSLPNADLGHGHGTVLKTKKLILANVTE